MNRLTIDVTEKQNQTLKVLLTERLAEAHHGGLVQGSIGELAEQALSAESRE